MEHTGKYSISTDRKTSEKTVDSSASVKPNGKSIDASVTVMKPNEKAAVSSANPMNPDAATALSSARVDQVMLFRDVSHCPREADLRFRLIHFWEARNPNTKTLIGQEMLLIDEEGFVPAGRVGTFDLVAGSVYNLSNFFGSRSKNQYRVADHVATVSFSWNSSLSVLENPPVLIPEDRFHSYEEFKANCDSKGDLYDYVGHMKLVNGQTITDHMVLDEDAIAEKWHLCVHVQTHDGPVMKLYLWDKVAADFCQKFKSYGSIPSVLLVTTVNPKHLGGTFAITSMSSSRVFMDADVQPTKDYHEWLSSNSDIANRIAAEVVTKPESVTLEKLFSYIKQEASKVVWFECMATIDDVVQGSAWYYISCDGCNNKAVKGPTSLICNNKKYLTRIYVYDKSEQAVFVILGDAGKELTGKHAAELVAKYFEANDGVGAEHCVPVPQALLDTIGQTRKSSTSIAVGEESGSSGSLGDTAGDRARKAAEILESDAVKQSLHKSGMDNTPSEEAIALADYVGHMKLVNGQRITDHMILDEVDIAEKRHLCVHVQTHDGPVMKLYLWDKAAADFCQKFKSYGSTPSVLLVTTVNPKHLGGTLALTSLSSSRVFMDVDVQPTKDYLEWLNSNSDIANRVAAEVVTKPETVTLEELFSYIKQDFSKVAWFECMATIDDVVQGSAWYYISCGGCNSKAVNGPTSQICNNKKCVKTEVTGVPQYLTRISVYDKSEQAVFVILGDAGKELTGKHAAELVANYFEANGGVGADHCVPVPQALLDTIGQTRKFIVKVSDHNMTGKTQTITVTKILPPEAPLPSTVGVESSSSGSSGDTAGDRARKADEILEAMKQSVPRVANVFSTYLLMQ
ncbi:hypothetical protein F2Q70_00026486 [Brassica cretica]|uniref:Replication factor A C-terminal domain-containing protein n=1 Tax=Brassica cretica TaxID=69181 RepID=A0A8S9LFI2_BRACR|nr:hypothetical protein F2Q70_00026486 [Brassica cretica]